MADWIDTRKSLGTFKHSADKLQLRKDVVLVEPETFNEHTESGLIQIEGVKDKEKDRGVVIRVGTKAKHIKAGDKILFGRHVGHAITFDDTRYIMMGERDVIGVLE